MTDTIAEIRARHEATRDTKDKWEVLRIAREAHADRAELLARVAELEAALTQPAAVEDGELRRLMAEATPGPWKIERGKRCIQGPDEQGDPVIITIATGGSKQWSSPPYGEYCVPGMKEGDANAALIVAAVNALPGLMAERQRLKERIAKLETPTLQWNPDSPETPIESVESLAEHFAEYGHPCGVFEVQNAHELPYTYHFYNVMKDSEEIDDDDPIETYEAVTREITKDEYKAGQAAAAIGWFAKRAKWATDRARAALGEQP